jgi:hypothetical protein
MNATVTRTIEDDLKSAREDKLPREVFLRRLLEHFVHVPTTSQGSTNGRFDIVLLAGEGDEGMFLPIFTSVEQFALTPLKREHTTASIPFDALMRQIRPDTGLIINPFTPTAFSIRWFVLQEYIPGFGANLVKQEVTPEWLEQLNAEFNQEELPHGRRADEALRRWSLANGIPISMSSLRAKQVYEWFRSNIKPGSDWIGPLADAVFYHGGAFWETTVPLCLGQPQMNPLDMLRMPASVKINFCRERNDVFVFLKFFADLYDYYYTVEDVRYSFRDNPLLDGFIGSGRKHLTSTSTFLLETSPNPKAAEEARTALEIFLKIFLVHRAHVPERELRNLSHDLHKLLARCLEVDPNSGLKHLEAKLGIYPDISARYRADQVQPRDLWSMYYTAVTAGIIAMRPMSDRDSAQSLGIPEF